MKTQDSVNTKTWTFWPERTHSQIAISTPYNKKFYSGAFLFLFCFTALVNTLFLNNELWQDELYTLDNFVLVPVLNTLTDYHTTNNHIVFNLIANLYLKLIQVKDLSLLLENPIIIRIVPYFFTLASVPAFYYGAKKIQGSLFAIIALSIYVSSLQTYTFGCQVRGYSLDILLSIILVNLILSYHNNPSKFRLVFIIISGLSLLINLPSTLYFFFSLILLVLASQLYPFKKIKWKKISQSADFKLFISLCITFFLFAVFFALKRNQLSQNSFIFNSGNSIALRIHHSFSVFYRFIDWRFFLLIPVFLLLIRPFSFPKNNISLLLAGLLSIPFVWHFLHNPSIILRIWLILLPVFCLFMAQLWMTIITPRIKLLIPFIGLSLLTILVSLYYLKEQTFANNERNFPACDLRYQYYLFGFNAMETLSEAKEKINEDNARTVLHDPSAFGMSYYLRSENPLPLDSIKHYKGKIFLISDRFDCFEDINIPRNNIIDSGKTNSIHFFKWYLLDKK